MTFQTKQAYIRECVRRVNNGLSWTELEFELSHKVGNSRAKRETLGQKVLTGVEQTHGPRIHALLLANQSSISAAGLHGTTFSLLRKRQEKFVRAALVNQMADELAQGKPLPQVRAQHAHRLLKDSDVELAVTKSKSRTTKPLNTIKSQRSWINLSDLTAGEIISGILTLAGLVVGLMTSSGEEIFIGILVFGVIAVFYFLNKLVNRK